LLLLILNILFLHLSTCSSYSYSSVYYSSSSTCIREPILITPKPFIPNEGPGTYILPNRKSREIANHKFKIYDTDETYDLLDPFDPHIEENTRNILYKDPEVARFMIHNDIYYDDEHMLVDSEEDNASTEEDSNDGYLEEVNDDETKAYDYLNEIPEEEVAEINDKILNYYFDMDKKKYVSKIKERRLPKKYAIMTHEKYMDN
jgi:hypothetical protein